MFIRTLCQYFQLGSCRYGDSCFYRHDGVDPKDAALAAKVIQVDISWEKWLIEIECCRRSKSQKAWNVVFALRLYWTNLGKSLVS